MQPEGSLGSGGGGEELGDGKVGHARGADPGQVGESETWWLLRVAVRIARRPAEVTVHGGQLGTRTR